MIITSHWESLHSPNGQYWSSRECKLLWWLISIIGEFTLPQWPYWSASFIKTMLVQLIPAIGYVPLSRSGSRCIEMITLPMALTGHWEVVEWVLVMLNQTYQYLYLEPSCLQCDRYWACLNGQYLNSWIPWDDICQWADSILLDTTSWPCACQIGPYKETLAGRRHEWQELQKFVPESKPRL